MDREETRFTSEFVRAALRPGHGRILEVGCGGGELAANLGAAGLQMTAADSDPDAVAAARELGVDARVAAWPAELEGPFDAVLFTRSLHHLPGPDQSLDAAVRMLAPGGRIIVEDFAYERADARTLTWFQTLARALLALAEDAPAFPQAIAEAPDPVAAWRAHHAHGLHTSAVIEAALRARSPAVDARPAAYYFRYLAPLFPGRVRFAAALRAHEEALIAQGQITPLGRRFVASFA